MRFKVQILSCVMFLASFAFANIPPEQGVDESPSDVYNNYINFINESMHGMLIVNKLLENYNLDLNKYVDLDSYRINNYTNEDLPLDVFQDPERMFFNHLTPYEWYDKCIAGSKSLDGRTAQRLNLIATNIKKEITTINTLRFDLDKITKGIDFSKTENIQRVYDKLEEGVVAFNQFYKLQDQLVNEINKLTAGKLNGSKYNGFREVYGICKTILENVRAKETEKMETLISRLEEKQKSFPGLLSQLDLNKSAEIKLISENLSNSLNGFLKSTRDFYVDGTVNDTYKIYGKFYYYHNIALLSKFNRYGSGFAAEINHMLMLLAPDEILVAEQPHLFQVIYPKRLVESPETLASDDYIAALPTTLKERKITPSTTILRADNRILELELFDHMIQDGDIVSINFNGDWILENAELERAPQKLRLKLNEDGRNYLLLHAVNVGKRPPNTVALKYKYRGMNKEIIMKSDLNTSELIEIVIQ